MALRWPGGVEWPDLLRRLYSWGGLGDPAREAEAQAIIDAYTLAEARAAKAAEVQARAATLQRQYMASRGWGEGEQAMVMSRSAGDITLQATTEGISAIELTTRLNAEQNDYRQFVARVRGNRDRHVAAIGQLSSFAAVRDHDHSTGWPAA